MSYAVIIPTLGDRNLTLTASMTAAAFQTVPPAHLIIADQSGTLGESLGYIAAALGAHILNTKGAARCTTSNRLAALDTLRPTLYALSGVLFIDDDVVAAPNAAAAALDFAAATGCAAVGLPYAEPWQAPEPWQPYTTTRHGLSGARQSITGMRSVYATAAAAERLPTAARLGWPPLADGEDVYTCALLNERGGMYALGGTYGTHLRHAVPSWRAEGGDDLATVRARLESLLPPLAWERARHLLRIPGES